MIKSADRPEARRHHEVAPPIKIDITSDGKIHLLETLIDCRTLSWSYEFEAFPFSALNLRMEQLVQYKMYSLFCPTLCNVDWLQGSFMYRWGVEQR